MGRTCICWVCADIKLKASIYHLPPSFSVSSMAGGMVRGHCMSADPGHQPYMGGRWDVVVPESFRGVQSSKDSPTLHLWGPEGNTQDHGWGWGGRGREYLAWWAGQGSDMTMHVRCIIQSVIYSNILPTMWFTKWDEDHEWGGVSCMRNGRRECTFSLV